NAGKSTLLNTLIGKDRAIVTDIAGTTRDTIDVDWSYDGLRFILTDTAGLRDTSDVVETEGVKRSQKAFEEADLPIYLKDLSHVPTPDAPNQIANFQRNASDTPFVLLRTKTAIAVKVADERLDYDLKVPAIEGEM